MNKPLLEYYRRKIGCENLEVERWVNNIPRVHEQWTRAYDNRLQWVHVTINLNELLNSVLKSTKNLPIIIMVLVKLTYFKLANLLIQALHLLCSKVKFNVLVSVKIIRSIYRVHTFNY
jgi:hypothetical protein